MITSHLNTCYFIPTTITTINQGLNSFKCMIRGASLLSLYRWHFTGILSAHWYYTTGAINHTKINDFASISLNLHHWVHDYFTIFQLLLQLLIKAIISNAYNIFIRPLSWFVDFSFNGFVGLKNTPVTIGPCGPMLSFGGNSPKRTWA